MSIFVLESTDKTQQRKLFSFLGVDYAATRFAWINPPLMMLAGILIAIIFAPVESFGSQLLVGIIYGFLIILTSFCHGLGHIFSSRMVNAPMQTLIATSTVHLTHYADEESQPSRVHLGRAIGGPLFNLALGLIAVILYAIGLDSHFLLFFGCINLLFVVVSGSPIPTVDGALIWRELRAK